MICSLSCRILGSQQHIVVLFTVSQNLQEKPGNLRTVITTIVSLEPEVKSYQDSISHILHVMEQSLFFFPLLISLLLLHIIYYPQVCRSHIDVILAGIPSTVIWWKQIKYLRSSVHPADGTLRIVYLEAELNGKGAMVLTICQGRLLTGRWGESGAR